MRVLGHLLDVHVTDPDDARRRRLLNILLAGTSLLCLLAMPIFLVMMAVPSQGTERALPLALAFGATLLGTAITYLINRYVSGWLASVLFLSFLTLVPALTDTPQEVVGGRTLFVFVIPVLMASALLRPWASFVWAGIASMLIGGIELFVLHGVPNVPSMLAFFAIALFAWLPARHLEQALAELRMGNKELDRRVAERTQELETVNEQLQDLDRLKTSFVALVSHELRTPLNAILGYADMLDQGIYGELAEQQRDANRRIITNVHQLSTIFTELLDIAQIQAGAISLRPEWFSPSELILHVQGTAGLEAEAKGLAFSAHLAEGLPKLLYGDRRRVEQILTHLLNNSIKFTEQGSITVHLSRTDNRYCAIEVTDTGPGIAEDAQDLVFEPFRQVDDSPTREHGGAGLGLSIAKQLATMMGGDIQLHSELGHGSTFSVTLPLIPRHAQREADT